VGQGTEFQVFLPAIAGTEPPVARAQELPMGQGELILIVDDEVNIRETLKITLENQNYRVLTAKDGIEAIATCAKHREDIKVVLMDMMMPSMDGSAAIHALQMLNSQIKIIACSGLTVRDPALEVGVKAFLAKPFSADVLLNTLHRVLREAA
jgi:CheY-like chemotaxis protein